MQWTKSSGIETNRIRDRDPGNVYLGNFLLWCTKTYVVSLCSVTTVVYVDLTL
jgi:hypothetical protein